MNNKLKILSGFVMCFATNLYGPTAMVRYASGNGFEVQYKTGISGRALSQVIEIASEVPFAKLCLRSLLGDKELKTIDVVPEAEKLEITIVRMGSELKVTPVDPHLMIHEVEYDRLKFQIHTPYLLPYAPSLPSTLEDLSNYVPHSLSVGSARTLMFNLGVDPAKLNQNKIYLMQALCDFSTENLETREYLQCYILLLFTLNEKETEGYFYGCCKKLFPELCHKHRLDEELWVEAGIAVRPKLIELLRSDYDDPHARNINKIMQDAGLDIKLMTH